MCKARVNFRLLQGGGFLRKALNYVFSIENHRRLGGIGISKDFAVGGGDAFNKAIGASRKRRDADEEADPSAAVIRRGRRQSQGQERPQMPGGKEGQEAMDRFKSGANKAKDQMQRGGGGSAQGSGSGQ